jgi:hypothetical protein
VQGIPQPYDALDMPAAGTNIVYMAVCAVVYLALAIGIDVGLSHPSIRLKVCGRQLVGQ